MSITPVHILIAEDDSDDVFMLENSLNEQFPHWQYTFFNNGLELISYLRNKADILSQGHSLTDQLPVSLIILDINMPRKDGIQTLKEIRQLSPYETTPVIGFSTTNSVAQVDEFIKYGGSNFLQKPDNYDDFHKLISRLPLLINKPSTSETDDVIV